MDLICPRCGEPWDFDSLHEEASARRVVYVNDGYRTIFARVQAEFRTKGCLALTTAFGSQDHCQPHTSVLTEAAAIMYELCGTDMDGAAAMLEELT